MPVKPLWAYAYQIMPPQPSGRLDVVQALLMQETATARSGARTWSGRLVFEEHATYILIVNDDPGRELAINRRIEAELRRLDAPFVVTEALAVTDEEKSV